MRLALFISSIFALLAVMHNTTDDSSGDPDLKRQRDVESEPEPCAEAIHSWMLADWQTNEGGSAWHATQGAQLRTNLIDRLLRDDYTQVKNELSLMNPTAFNSLKAVCTSKSRMLAEMRGGAVDEHRDNALEMLLSAQVRLHTTNVYLFPTAALSLLAVRNGLDKTFWSILSSMRLVYGYKFSHELSAELGERIRSESAAGGMSSITFAAADNKGYYIKTNEEHSEEGRRNEFLQTVNWLTSIVPLWHGIGEVSGSFSALAYTVSTDSLWFFYGFFHTC
jgi:hypothetical protein